MKKHPIEGLLLILIIWTAACTYSVQPPDSDSAALSTALPDLGNAAQSSNQIISQGATTIRDFLLTYTDLLDLLVGYEGEEVTVVAKVITDLGPVIMIAALDDALPVIGQADNVIILALVAGAVMVYSVPDLVGAIAESVGNIQFSPRNPYVWQPEAVENSFAALGLIYMAADASHSGWQAMDPGGFNLPEPPDGCKIIQALTGQPCRWEVWKTTGQNGQPVIEIILKSGDQIVGKFQGMRVTLSEFSELATHLVQGSYAGAQGGWITYIETAAWLRGMGFGKLLWKAGDVVAKSLSAQQFAEQGVRLFADKAGWGPSLLSGVNNVVTIGESLWMYVIP